ncbi:hypothetical protein EBZ80_08850 [bacterium]|nr:hypothetical protein [bacterium]
MSSKMASQVFSTDRFQTYPDYALRAETLVKKNNNPRYKFFRQNHFTAGDEDQFLEWWDRSTPRVAPRGDGGVLVHPNVRWSRYQKLCVDDVIHTYHYIADKFKKGIFFKVVDGVGKTYLPFSKVAYTNEWADRVRTNPRRFRSVEEMVAYTCSVEKREFVESRIHKNTRAWYGNNGLVRFEFPISEGDSGVGMIRDMLATLLRERSIPSCEVFLNKRDFPILKKDGTESYDSFFGNTPLLSHRYNRYCPILGMTTSCHHADIPIPTWEDWCRAAYWADGRLFPKEYRALPRLEAFDAIPWSAKRPTAVFRGASTGLGTTTENNPRLMFSAESAGGRRHADDLYLDAGITRWNLRPRKHPSFSYLETIHVEEMPFGLVEPLDPLAQASYKYLLHLPGHSEAYRLGTEMFMGSVILYYPCEYQVWFFQWLKPWVHYVPLVGTTEDFYDKMDWCLANDDKCREIAANARAFAEQHLTRTAMLDYLERLFRQLYKTTGRIVHAPASSIEHNLAAFDEVVAAEKAFLDGAPVPSDTLSREALAVLLNRPHERRNRRMLRENRATSLEYFEFQSRPLCEKQTSRTWKHEDRFHVLCALSCVNALAVLPNFVYTYGHRVTDTTVAVVMDFVPGRSMDEYLRSADMSLGDVLDAFLCLSLALETAQQRCGFLHMDLFPWNVIVRSERQTVAYDTRDGRVRVSSALLPVMIDYGKSCFLREGRIHTNTCPFRYCRLQDIMSLVFSSFWIILESRISDKDTRTLVRVMNFFAGSEYTRCTAFHNIFQVKSFLKKHKKFSSMMSEPKTGLEDRSPLEFFRFLRTLRSDSVDADDTVAPIPIPLAVLPTDYRLAALALDTIPPDADAIVFRSAWIMLENLLAGTENADDAAIRRLAVFRMLERLRERIRGEKVWENLDPDTLLAQLRNAFPIDAVAASDTTTEPAVPFYPLYPTHPCPSCRPDTAVPDPKRFRRLCLRRWLDSSDSTTDWFLVLNGACVC